MTDQHGLTGTVVQDGGEPTGFEEALDGLEATGASTSIRELVDLLVRHGSQETTLLADYEKTAVTITDPAARYLIELIMDDERRHHRLLSELASAMAWDTMSRVEHSVPPLGWNLDEDLCAASRRLRRYESQDRRELRALRRRLSPFKDTTVWSLVIELVLLDTKKHITILKFLERHGCRE
jgi:hypothetical protein